METWENAEDNFEGEWRDAFEGMTQAPPDSVWKELDRELAYVELATYKARVGYYQWAAAAALVLAGFLGMAWFFTGKAGWSNNTPVAGIEIDRPVPMSELQLQFPERETKPANAQRSVPSARTSGLLAFGTDSEEEGITTSNSPASTKEFIDIPLVNRQEVLVSVAPSRHRKRGHIFLKPDYSLAFAGKSKTRDQQQDRYWAGLNLGSSTFDPNYQGGGNALVTNSLAADGSSSFFNANAEKSDGGVREGMKAGTSVALGMNFGMQLTGKWSLESGLLYTRSDAVTSTNMVIESFSVREDIPVSSQLRGNAAVAEIVGRDDQVMFEMRDVDMNNQFQFATVPVKVGYRLIDSRLSLALNAGVAANMYLGNRLEDPNSELIGVTLGPGETSPYRSVSLSGLAGVQLGYNLFERLAVTVAPSYTQSINSLTKDQADFVANPSGIGVMTGLRYRFK